MNMLKFGHGIVLDGLPDITEFHFFSGIWTPRDPIKFKCCIHISEILECLERCMSGSQACRGSPHGSIEKEMRHFMGGSRGGGQGLRTRSPPPPSLWGIWTP